MHAILYPGIKYVLKPRHENRDHLGQSVMGKAGYLLSRPRSFGKIIGLCLFVSLHVIPFSFPQIFPQTISIK